jgi:hypothetical protein
VSTVVPQHSPYSNVRRALEQLFSTNATEEQHVGESIRWKFGELLVTYSPKSRIIAVISVLTGSSEMFPFEWSNGGFAQILQQDLHRAALNLLTDAVLATV